MMKRSPIDSPGLSKKQVKSKSKLDRSRKRGSSRRDDEQDSDESDDMHPFKDK